MKGEVPRVYKSLQGEEEGDKEVGQQARRELVEKRIALKISHAMEAERKY